MVREGQVMPAYYGEQTNSCALDRCMARAKEMIGWDENTLAEIWETVKCEVWAWRWQCRAQEFLVWMWAPPLCVLTMEAAIH